MVDTAFQGWQCTPIYIISHPEHTEIVPDGEEHVFDGAHKLEALIEFMDGAFPLKATATSCKEIKDHTGKFFKELPIDLKMRIRKYRFVINMIDDETAHDPERLQTLWERLNHSGMKLNSYELQIPVIRELITTVLKPAGEMFKNTVLFTKDSSHRGDLEQLLQLLLAVIDNSDPGFASLNALIRSWHTKELGSTMAERAANVAGKKARWMDGLTRCHKILEDLTQLNVFYDPATETVNIADALRKTELPFVLGRLARRFPLIENFRSQKMAISSTLRNEIFSKSPVEMLALIGGTGRNGVFQKKLLRVVDVLVDGFVGIVHPRLFTKMQKKAKLKEQGGVCPLCNLKILAHQLLDGDHVWEWSEGGSTDMENLQILHRHCHQLKGSGSEI